MPEQSIILDIPVKIKLIPTKLPMTQMEVEGKCAQIRKPRMRVIMPSSKTQPAFRTFRMLKYKTISSTPPKSRKIASRSVSEHA